MNNLLFVLKTPPPHTGATYMNNLVFTSQVIENNFNLKKIAVSYSSKVADLGKFQIKKFFVFFRILFKYTTMILVRRPDLIYFQPSISGLTYLRDLTLILIGKLLRIKFVIHLHGKGIAATANRSQLFKFLYECGLNRENIIVLSESQKKDVEFLKPRSIHVVNNGIEKINSEFTDKSDSSNETFKFLFLSNLLKSKGVFDLLEVVKNLKAKKYDFIVEIVGNEGNITKTELAEYIEQNDLAKFVNYHGPKYGTDKYWYYKNCDAFVFPTKNEAFGLVLLEAMQFSLPIIATNEGAIPEIVENNQSGFVYPKEDTASLQKYMEEFIKNPLMAREFGKVGRIIYEKKFTKEIFEQNMINTFKKILNK